MKALFIDPAAQTVTDIDYPDKLAGLYELIGNDNLDHAVIGRTAGVSLCLWVDGGGYYKPELKWWRLTFYPNPLAGPGVICAADEIGETTEIPACAETFVGNIEWLAARPHLPDATVMKGGKVVARVDFNAADAPKTLEETYTRLFGGDR